MPRLRPPEIAFSVLALLAISLGSAIPAISHAVQFVAFAAQLPSITTPTVFQMSDRFEVIGVDASRVTASMVNVEIGEVGR
jgi:hypothetical protein